MTLLPLILNKVSGKLFLFWLLLTVCTIDALAIEKRGRWAGLYKSNSSSVMGKENLYISIYGRAYLWDNGGGQKPTIIPHIELGYGFWDYFDVFGGLQVMTTRPSLLFMKLKVTSPNNKNIRFIGLAQTFEIYSNLSKEFKSNGFRYGNEGFTSDHFKYGGSGFLASYKFMTTLDIEFIKISTWLPFKLYLNAGLELPVNSWMRAHKETATVAFRDQFYSNDTASDFAGTTNFAKLPVIIGLELKTHTTDFFVELESEIFYEHFKQLFGSAKGSEKYWVRYNVILESGDVGFLKIFDMHLMESPIYVNIGGNLKYANGLSLMGGFSWLLSRDYGGKLGGCDRENLCHGEKILAPREGYSPFYPQWKLFGGIKYPFKFHQTSAELYRTYLLRKNRKSRKVIDIDSNIKSENEK